MNDEERILILGALLHDVGKFLERAGFTEKIEDNNVSYKHPMIGAYFLDYLNLGEDIVNLVLFHHNPEHAPKNIKNLSYILQLSDWLSSGERKKSEEEIDEGRRFQCMISVFNRVKIEKNNSDLRYEECHKYNTVPLKFNNLIFPKKRTRHRRYKYLFEGIKNKNNQNYKLFLSNFRKDITEKNIEDPVVLLSLLQKYWWCVPAQTYSKELEGGKYLPDISLFDHSKTTCSIALCLYKLNKTGVINGDILKELLENPPWKENRNPEVWERKLFKLIYGDISGIQDFIYTIRTSGAAKSLKGRSLALVLLQRFIAEHILMKLNLQLTNLIFSGGGHFYILAPLDLCGENIEDIKREINKKLFEKFGTKLYLTLGYVELCPEDFIGKNFSNKWKEVAEENNKQKIRKYKELGYEEIFKEFDIGGKSKICGICGSNREVNYKDDEIDVCSNCHSFRNVVSYLKEVQNEGRFNISKIKKELPIISDFDILLNDNVYLTPDNLPFFSIPIGIPHGKDGKIKEFNELAEDAENDTGTRKIAILKMDVDNLGKIFTQGLGEDATISRMSTLSNMLSLFFEGYLNEFIRSRYSDDVYLIYSGGDDTLIVCRWDKMIYLAYDIYKEFRAYTCNNPDITISAGIVIVDPKYPLRKSVDVAHHLLDEIAKEGDKNAVGIFGHRVKWRIENDGGSNEFEKVIEIERILVKSIKSSASKQLIQRVKSSIIDLEKGLNGMEVDLKYYWRLKYYLHRNYYNEKENCWKIKEIEDLKKKIYNDILDRNVFNKDVECNPWLIPIAARIAELKTRKEVRK
ncbi:MAG: type III-A CRISPR-associated protein Cas10/Csm1 [Candidatus Altiarchaeota archaeon]